MNGGTLTYAMPWGPVVHRFSTELIASLALQWASMKGVVPVECAPGDWRA